MPGSTCTTQTVYDGVDVASSSQTMSVVTDGTTLTITGPGGASSVGIPESSRSDLIGALNFVIAELQAYASDNSYKPATGKDIIRDPAQSVDARVEILEDDAAPVRVVNGFASVAMSLALAQGLATI